jgi:Xaa-Pro aminopeptidase
MAMIKTKAEIACMERAAAISNSCIPIIRQAVKEGATEKEIGRRVRENIYRRGGRLSFRTLVASGDRSAMVHCKPTVTDRPVDGIGYVDFGASYRGYKADVTVPFIRGKVGEKERKIVRTVIGAYDIAVRSWRPGIECWKLHKEAERHISSNGLEMGHSLGHGVGLRIHERPIIYAPNDGLLRKVEILAGKGNEKAIKRLKRWERVKKVSFQKNMAFTIEPGAYVRGLGGCRIENTFLTVGKRLKCLTKSRLIEV